MTLIAPPKPENFTLTVYLPNNTVEEWSTGRDNVKGVGFAQNGATMVEFNDGSTIIFHPSIPHKLERRPAPLFTQ